MANKKINVINIILLIFLILFSLLVIYQLFRKILGGSGTMESILISMNIVIITSILMIAGFLINLARSIGKIEGNFENIKNSFAHLAQDFKEHIAQKKN